MSALAPRWRLVLAVGLVALVTFVTGTAYAHSGAMPDTLRWLPITAPLAIWLAAIACGRHTLPRTALDGPLAAALLWLAVTVVFATERRLAFEFAWPILLHAGLLLLLVDLMRRGWARAFGAALAGVALIVVAVSAVELLAWYFGWLGEPGWYPVAGLRDPIPPLMPTLDLALNISTIEGNTVAVLIPLAVAGMLASRRHAVRGAVGGLAAALFTIELLTFSRGGLLGALAALGVLAAFGVLRWGRRSGRLSSLLQPRIVLGAALFAVVGAGLLMIVWSAGQQRSASDQGRVDTWRSAIDMASDQPVTGVGPGLFGRALRSYRDPELAQDKLVSAHDLPLNVLAETGVPGLLILLWAVIAFGRAWWRVWTAAEGVRRILLEGALAALIAYAVHSLVDTFPLTSSVLPLLIVIAYTLAEPVPDAPRRREVRRWWAVAGLGVLAVYGAAFIAFDVAQGWMLLSQRAADDGDLEAALTRARRAQTWDAALSLYDLQEAYVLGLLAAEQPSDALGDAIEAHEGALAHEPTFDLGWANLAGLYAQAGDDLAAREAMRRAVTIDPANARGWFWLRAGQRALEADPDLAEYVRDADPAGLQAYLADVDNPAGERLYVAVLAGWIEEADSFAPQAEREGGWLSWLALGMYEWRMQDDPAVARAWLDRAVAARPADERPLLERAAVALSQGDPAGAEADARRALFVDRYGGALANAILAEIAQKDGVDDVEVEALLRASVRPRPEPDYFVGTVYARPGAFDPLPQLALPGTASHTYAGWFALAERYLEQGQPAQARAVYENLLALNPYLREAAAALDALPDDEEE